MRRFCLYLFVSSFLALTACAVSEPNPTGKDGPGGKTFDLDSKDNPVVVMETSMGTVKITLFQEASPITVKNFLQYVDEKHYDGTIFHRVIPDFMVQGGGFTPGLREKGAKHDPINNEAINGVSNVRGTLAMARTGDPNSATDQFFINVENNQKLDRGRNDKFGYAVFGKVIEGMDVVDQIRKVRTADTRGHEAVPIQDVVIKSIRRADST